MKKLLLFSVAFFFFAAPSALATTAPVINGSITHAIIDGSPGATSLTWSHTIASGLSNSALFVYQNGTMREDATSATWNGTGLTKGGTSVGDTGAGTTWWYIANPSADGSAHNVVVNWTTTNWEQDASAVTLTGVNQTTPGINGDYTTNTGTSISTTFSTLVNNSLIFAWATANDNVTMTSTGTNQTDRDSQDTASRYVILASQTAATAGSFTQSFSVSASATAYMGSMAVQPVPDTASAPQKIPDLIFFF